VPACHLERGKDTWTRMLEEEATSNRRSYGRQVVRR
jgi:hypothetical protein